jgi:hypothetical protein
MSVGVMQLRLNTELSNIFSISAAGFVLFSFCQKLDSTLSIYLPLGPFFSFCKVQRYSAAQKCRKRKSQQKL